MAFQAPSPPLSSQPETTNPSQDENSLSPLAQLEKSTGSKPRKKPTVTPRTFTRFFTPRSSLGRVGKIGASRQALRDITASVSASNRKAQTRRRTQPKDSVNIFADENDGVGNVQKRRKIVAPISPDTTPDRSSPLKRIRGQSLDCSEDDSTGEAPTDGEDIQPRRWFKGRRLSPRNSCIHPNPIVRSKCRGTLDGILNRELGITGGKQLFPRVSRTDWQCETTNFYTLPEDSHVCDNLGAPSEQAIPFCVTSCHTNSLVAVGDEEGGIRLLESAREGKPRFNKAYLAFRPHANAILDLAFSSDDLLLATASGDQSSQVIDMPTRRAIYTLSGHVSSLKQVLFQPGSSSVLATSSRDGSVRIWDLRCKGCATPALEYKISLDGNNDTHQPRTRKVAYPRAIDTIAGAHASRHLGPLPSTIDTPSKTETPSRRGDVSVTALSFLPAGRENLLLTASEADATVKLWDLRFAHHSRRRGGGSCAVRPTALSATAPPDIHTRYRHFGITSLALSSDAARLYTLCRDNTVYAYSTAHLLLGSAPELAPSSAQQRQRQGRARYFGGEQREGRGPLYGFRHQGFHATTFYVKLAVRGSSHARRGGKSELLAAGSSDGCVVLWPTDERYMDRGGGVGLEGVGGGGFGLPIYSHGTKLVRGHEKEVTGVSWAYEGELVSVGDDLLARCWREDEDEEEEKRATGGEGRPLARELRTGGETGGRRWGRGWAEVEKGWDEDED
ncbi:MAG: hypothetical protein LQ351_006504 [Letrouitia transgressa]|nr:MAG: hypothetical protein LQ351_006504 [Letrouitia transgressa]